MTTLDNNTDVMYYEAEDVIIRGCFLLCIIGIILYQFFIFYIQIYTLYIAPL
jgi:hypothetical protein